jgi:hypothetical protein
MIRSIVTAVLGVICLTMLIVPFQAAIIGHVDLFIVVGIAALSALAGFLVYPKKSHYLIVVALATFGFGCTLIPFMFRLFGTVHESVLSSIQLGIVHVTMLMAGVLFVSFTAMLINDLKSKQI